jgi:hypothetical protein
MQLSLEYLAGFFDGEGCVYYRAKTRDLRVLDVRVIVTNTDLRVLKEFERRFGGKITKKTADESRTMDCYQWIGWNSHGLKAMKALVPFLVLKKSKAETYIKLCATMRQRCGAHPVSTEELEQRRLLCV